MERILIYICCVAFLLLQTVNSGRHHWGCREKYSKHHHNCNGKSSRESRSSDDSSDWSGHGKHSHSSEYRPQTQEEDKEEEDAEEEYEETDTGGEAGESKNSYVDYNYDQDNSSVSHQPEYLKKKSSLKWNALSEDCQPMKQKKYDIKPAVSSRKLNHQRGNITKEEKKTLEDIRRNQNLVDKCKATVVMDRQDYNMKIQMLLDTDHYKKLNKDPTTKISYRCLRGYCYHVVRNTTYPPICPYQDRVSYAEYDNIIFNVITNIFGIYYWIGVQRNEDYGYYEWLDLGDNYGDIFNQATYSGGDCVIIRLGLANHFHTEDCNNLNQGLCIYRLREKNNSFCDTYEDICGTSSKCYCYAKRANFSCQAGCSNYVNDECDQCERKFDDYPEPSIKLRFLPVKGNIYITIENSLKLAYVNGNSQIFCFSDVYTPSTTKVRYRYNENDMKLVRTHEDTVMYSIKPRDLGPGSYWCKGFKYPNFEEIKSNVIIADIAGTYSADFVLNLTLHLGDEYTFLPYNIHTKATKTIDTVLDYDFKSIRPAYVSEIFKQGTAVNLSFHLTTKLGTNTSEVYDLLSENLNSLADSQEMIADVLTNSKTCIATTSIIDKKKVTWPETRLGQVTPPVEVCLQSDGTSITRSCLGSFQMGAEWGEITGIISANKGSAATEDLIAVINSNKTANERNHALKGMLTNFDDEYVAYDVYLIGQIFQNIAQSGEPFDMDVFVENMNSVMKFDRDFLHNSQINLNATDIILYSFDLALISSINNNRGNMSEVHNVTVTSTRNIFAQVANLKANNIIGIAAYENGGSDEYIMVNITRDMELEDIVADNLVFAVFLPQGLLDQIFSDQPHTDEINLVTAIFFSGALFNTANYTRTEDSLILSMFVDGFQPAYLQEPIPIIFKSLQGRSNEKYCGFWRYGIDELWVGIFGFWSVDKYAIYNSTYQMCKFTHLTHFALLVSGIEDVVLNYISLIGCVLSILGILGIFATAIVSKSWREGSGTKILLNYSGAILIQMIVLLFSNLIDEDEQTGLCIFSGMVIHYTIISQFIWMLIISYLQYRKFVQVLVQEPKHIIIKSCLFAWLSPFLFIIIVSASDTDSYHHNNSCYLWGLALYLALFAPIITVISINVILFILIFKSVLYKKTQAYGVNKKLVGLKIKLAVILFFLMGFSWIFGLFAGVFKSLFLSYVFSITATVQGLVLYLYFVICNKVTRKIWTRKINQLRSLCNKGNKFENEDTKSSTSSDDFKMKK
ncbi:hypothetical protein Trydic_g6508 [Trypoxylus dichotomus]